MFNFRNNVSKLELRKSLEETIKKNDIALDYLQNKISFVDNLVKYNENDDVSKEELNNLRYIEFCLKYLDGLYRDNLKKVCK